MSWPARWVSFPPSLLFPSLSLDLYYNHQAGLNMLMLCCSEEFKKDGILFLGLHPGWVRTDMGSVLEEANIPGIGVSSAKYYILKLRCVKDAVP